MRFSGGHDEGSYEETYGEYGAGGGYAGYSIGLDGAGSGGGDSYGGWYSGHGEYRGYDIREGTYKKRGGRIYNERGEAIYRKDYE